MTKIQNLANQPKLTEDILRGFGLGRQRLRAGHRQAAQRLYHQSTLGVDDDALRFLADHLERLDMYSRDNPDAGTQLRTLGLRMEDYGDYSSAAVLYEEAIEYGKTLCLRDLPAARYHSGDFSGAVAAARIAYTRNEPHAFSYLGDTLLEAGDVGRADQMFDEDRRLRLAVQRPRFVRRSQSSAVAGLADVGRGTGGVLSG